MTTTSTKRPAIAHADGLPDPLPQGHPRDVQDLQRWRRSPPTGGSPWAPWLAAVVTPGSFPEDPYGPGGLFAPPLQGQQLDDVDPQGRSLLHWAVITGEVSTVKTLLNLGANPFLQDAQGDTPLHKAIRHEESIAQTLVPLLVHLGVPCTVPNQAGRTVLDELRQASTTRAQALLHGLKTPIGPDLAHRRLWDTLNVSQALVIRTDAWRSMMAQRVRHWLEQGANPCAPDPSGSTGAGARTPVQQAFAKRLPGAVQALLDAGARIDGYERPGTDDHDGIGLPFLHEAVWDGKLALVHVLLNAGAPVNETAGQVAGSTPLHLALQGGRDVFQALLDAGADPTVPNAEGRSVWDLLNDPDSQVALDLKVDWARSALVQARAPVEQAELRAALDQHRSGGPTIRRPGRRL